MPGKVVQIFICPTKGQPMEEVAEVYASRETGLKGDRYGMGEGSWSRPHNKTSRQVSLIAVEAIAAANEKLLTPILSIETRRNIVVEGVDLNALVSKEFSIGEVRLLGTKLCEPCERPAFLAGRTVEERRLFPIAFDNQGGLCAEIVVDGFMRPTDSIVV